MTIDAKATPRQQDALPASTPTAPPFAPVINTHSGASRPRGRFAPSPTGLLHLGNAWAFLLAWLACRSRHGTMILRMEDIDPDRSRTEYALGILNDLHWLGLDFDEGPLPDGQGECGPCAPYTQSRRLAVYDEALRRLNATGNVYPCYCTRKELRNLAGAPHVDDRGAPYPGFCRNLTMAERASYEALGRKPCLRLNCCHIDSTGPLRFDDLVRGRQSYTLAACGGDFALRRSDGVPAYQLAVAVDDALMGVTQVVRGDDILVSTPRQLALLDLLQLPHPEYAHVPLLYDASGERLAKRHSSLTLRALAGRDIPAAAVIGYLAWKAGFIESLRPFSPRELLPAFAFGRLPTGPVLLESDPVELLRSCA